MDFQPITKTPSLHDKVHPDANPRATLADRPPAKSSYEIEARSISMRADGRAFSIVSGWSKPAIDGSTSLVKFARLSATI